jgi:glycosyltransferase involved in cell wall biosynthesis
MESVLMAEVDIAVPCYNCGPWLDAMIASILTQNGHSWRIIARDDGSKDNTSELLAAWQNKLGARMVVLENRERRNLGLVGNYNTVLAATDAPFVLTADPDDVWLPGHMSRILGALRNAGDELGSQVPVAVFTDAAVVDEHQNPIAASYWKWTRSNPRRMRRIADVAMESPSLGSTMGVNRALLDVALPIAPGAVGQDWWLALAAVTFGRIHALDEVSILYRRHTSNNSGYPFGTSLAAAIRTSLVTRGAARDRLKRVLLEEASTQAAAFVERFQHCMPKKDVDDLKALGDLRNIGPISRRIALIRHGLTFASLIKNCGMFALC